MIKEIPGSITGQCKSLGASTFTHLASCQDISHIEKTIIGLTKTIIRIFYFYGANFNR